MTAHGDVSILILHRDREIEQESVFHEISPHGRNPRLGRGLSATCFITWKNITPNQQLVTFVPGDVMMSAHIKVSEELSWSQTTNRRGVQIAF